MTQIATNATALRNLADRLERLGYTGDDVHQVAEHIATALLSDGYRPLEPEPAKSGPGSDAATRARLLAEARAELAERKRARGVARQEGVDSRAVSRHD